MCVNICEKNSDLKSNMDRFIEQLLSRVFCQCRNLKSNMDRFIGFPIHLTQKSDKNLKSNMDRFIGARI